MTIVPSHGMHHLHKRKRAHAKEGKLAKYPHTNPKIKFLDSYITVIASIGPLVILPQIIKIYSSKDASGIAAITFFLIAFANISWLIYGFVHKERPIIITHMMFFTANILIGIGAVLYG